MFLRGSGVTLPKRFQWSRKEAEQVRRENGLGGLKANQTITNEEQRGLTSTTIPFPCPDESNSSEFAGRVSGRAPEKLLYP